jgi:nicotinate-nucleotide--dimethylbenzimidazole phosphoribosyltransferase
VEIGHTAVLEKLELEPLVALDLRLGEGSGAALILPLLDAAAAVLGEMTTFEEARVASARQREPDGAQSAC